MKLRNVLLSVLVLSGMLVHAESQGAGPRIAIVGGTDRRHANEFDLVMEKLNWEAKERYISTPESMKKLAGQLDEFDMLLFTPLFNYKSDPMVLPGEDRKAFMKFMNDGGLMVITDGSYPVVRKWVEDLDPRFKGLDTGDCNSSQWNVSGRTYDTEPAHPMRFFPWKIGEPNSWPHFKPFAKDTKWTMVAYCNEGFPVTVCQRVGKGMLYYSVLRQTTEKQHANFWANLQLLRAGIEFERFEMTPPALGEGLISATLKGEVKGMRELVYRVKDAKGKMVEFVGTNVVNKIEVPYTLSFRGMVSESLTLRYDGKEATLFTRQSELPQLLTLRSNAYRGVLSTKRRVPTVKFGVELEPHDEQLDDGRVQFEVLFQGVAKVATETMELSTNWVRKVRYPLTLDKSLPAGPYTLKATLFSKHNRKMAEAETQFQILEPRPAQTIIDEDGTFLVNGKPFFPLGIYHMHPDDFGVARQMGLNTVQFWTWNAGMDQYGVRRGVAAANAAGLKCIVELNHRGERIYRQWATDLRDDTAVLMWYSVDEPSESSYAEAIEKQRVFHEEDVNHPVYALSCRPDIFAEQAQFCDVFAIDPYGSTQKVLEWTTNAVTALDGQKPLVVVPSSFENSGNDFYRSQLYVSLACGARGVVWYPWSQSGGGPLGVGLKNHPEAQGVVSQLCHEVSAMLPALARVDRRSFASEDGAIRALLMKEGNSVNLLFVNSTEKPVTAKMSLPGMPENFKRELRDYFKKEGEVELTIENNEFEITLKGYETRVFK